MALLLGKVDKQDLDQQLGVKADLAELQAMLCALEAKFEDDFAQINDQLTRRARTEDLTYYRKEQNFKASKEELDTLRLELNDRISGVYSKVQENDRYAE
jgi:hypothetical protein